VKSNSQREILKINSSHPRQLQAGSKISRINTKSETRDKIYISSEENGTSEVVKSQ
jgi:hypothetical protein